MNPTTSYKAFDGSLFESAKECADYETHCRAIAKIIDKLPRFPITDDFVIGKVYYQHDDRIFLPVRDEFFMYLDSVYNNPKLLHPELRLAIGERVLLRDRIFWHEMFIKHSDHTALLAWRYIGYTDDYFRQWGQLMFAIKEPDGAKPMNE